MVASVSEKVTATALNVILHSGRYFPSLLSGKGTLGYGCFVQPANHLSTCDDGFAQLLGHDNAESLLTGLVMLKELVAPLFRPIARNMARRARMFGIEMFTRSVILCKKNPLHFIRLFCFVRISTGICLEVLEVEKDFLLEEDVKRMLQSLNVESGEINKGQPVLERLKDNAVW